MSAPLRLAVASLALVVLLPASWPRPAEAQIRRCTGNDGGTIFTDRACTDVDAVERVGTAAGAARAPYRGGCQRRLQDLVFEVTSAIDARDANRLAGVYHWPGTSSRSGYAIVDRLDGIARRPLVDITALRPAMPVGVAGPPPGAAPLPSTAAPVDGQAGAQAFASSRAAAVAKGSTQDTTVDGNRYPKAARARAPVALRLDQTLADGVTPSRTTLGLRRHMDCWWISL